ncbi:hypothetical protein [Burkholderia sp. MSMB1826]|uniref:hypothetical protein n=1 Tax=Burkholderia sp. MSMB1826 TaxID=1637875 RepID=UPI000B0E6FBB|nr:hypothetical protein [Burkholderia sp. MSMB1826]
MTWFIPVMLGALAGAIIAAAVLMLSRYLTWLQDNEERAEHRAHERANLAEQRARAKLDAALTLEAFAKQAAGYLDSCEVRIADWIAELDGDTQAKQRSWPPLVFDVSFIKDRSTVPIEIVSACHDLKLALSESDAWVREVSKEEWLDVDDAYRLDGQRALLYGLVACELARQIRSEINVPTSVLSDDCFGRLQREFGKFKRRYESSHGRIDLIPDLKARLQRELPEVADGLPEESYWTKDKLVDREPVCATKTQWER